MIKLILEILFCSVTLSIIAQEKPNIILIMADDLGYGDVGFNGNTIIKTPHMDAMANSHLKLTHFYAGAPVCSPTRGTCLTGRHAYRYGIFAANEGHLPAQEVTIAKLLKQNGYITGHFGKWHIGTLDPNFSSKGDARDPEANFAPPWQRDYDESFVTESSVSTWDPLSTSVPYYDNGVITTDNLEGDDSRVMMDRVVPFIENAVSNKKPFLSVIWFHAPHEPFVAGPDYKAMYPGYTEDEKNYYGCITAMDDQIGRLQAKLEELNIDDNTIIFFCSDNGPEGKELDDGTLTKPGVTGGLRGRKRSVYRGGTGVPAFIIWPGKTDTPSVSEYTCSTLDYLPTIIDALGISMPDERPLDGISLLPMLDALETERPQALPFMHKSKAYWIDGDLKFITKNNWDVNEVYNLKDDPFETTNIKSQHSNKVAEVQKQIEDWNISCYISHSGGDYDTPFTPVALWEGIPQATAIWSPKNINCTIYPNPATDYISLQSLSHVMEVKIFNAQGQLVSTIKDPKHRISVVNLKTGHYILKATTKKNEVAVNSFLLK
ncbi:T9SS type A sorting domain-containing protein [Labilibacter sediminis]|nr:T9SS type A sorting domain-containing protein [Labilibacter sediminis]